MYSLCLRSNKSSCKVKEKQNLAPEMFLSQPPTSQIEELQREAFNVMADMVSARWGAGAAHNNQQIWTLIRYSGHRENLFKDRLTKVTTWASHKPLQHVCFTNTPQG